MSKRRRKGHAVEDRRAVSRPESQARQDYRWVVALALSVVTAAVFESVRTFGFVRFDDPDYVTANPEVTAGLTGHGFKWALTTGHIANWHPLTWLSHMLDVQLFGVNAGAHHLTNVVFHVLNTVLLFVVLHRMTGDLKPSAFTAALFAIHPLHVESVAWISERKDVLSTFFWMLALLAYTRFARDRRMLAYGGVVLFFVLGLLAKPMVVTLPFVLLLLDVWPLRRLQLASNDSSTKTMQREPASRLVSEKLPLFGLAAASSIVTLIVQRRWGAVGSLAVYPLSLRVENALVNYVEYIGKMLWPARLAAFYPYPQSVSPLAVAGSAILLVVVTIVVALQVRRRPYLLVGWLWYLGTLAPVIGVVQAGMQSMADRYTYIPLIGLFIIVAWGTQDVAERWGQRRLLVPAAAMVLIVCAVVTRQQMRWWRDSLSLWQRSVDVTSENAYGQYNLGVVLVQAGRIDDGIARFREALRVDPNYADVHIDLANALNQRGAADEAIAEFATVVRLRPDYAGARVAYGSLLRSRGKNAEAAAQLTEAVRLDPTLATAHNELGNVLTSEGRLDEAIARFAEAIRLSPNFAEAHNNLGAAYARSGKTELAIQEFLAATRLKPADAMFHYNAALMLEQTGRTKEAVEQLQSALRADPKHEPARRALDRIAPGGASS